MVMFLLMIVMIAQWHISQATDLDDLAVILSKPLQYAFGVHDSTGASMDCLQIFTSLSENSSQRFYGVYHYNIPSTDIWDIYLAESETGPFGPWIRKQSLVSKIGSMPFVHYNKATGYYILAFEQMDTKNGNFPSFYFYSSLSGFLSGEVLYATSLMKRIHSAALPNTYTTDYNSNIRNIGTPSITSAEYIDGIWILYVRFHFTTIDAPEVDTPGYGAISFNPTKENDTLYYNWQGYFDNDASNAIQIARHLGGGKIGQRSNLRYNNHNYYLYEAQLNSSFDWHNWRLFLYSPQEQRAVQLLLNIEEVIDFANPSAALPDISIDKSFQSAIMTVFVPSEAITSKASADVRAGTLVFTLPPLTDPSYYVSHVF
jgi:hypothetical protein